MAPSSVHLRAWLSDALKATYEDDYILFLETTHERSIVFHVARRLAARLDHEAPEYSVDVDYDRWHRNEIGYIKKRLAGLRPDDLNKTNDVYPDIIVHRRSGSSNDHNLLVVEAKKGSHGHARDRMKLRLFQEQLHYQNAVFVILGSGGQKPQWQWISKPAADIEAAF